MVILKRIVISLFGIVPLSVEASDIYKVEVTRKSQDLYEVVGQNIYIKTRYCYEYVYFEEVILELENMRGYNIGELIFINSGGNKCDVEKLLK